MAEAAALNKLVQVRSRLKASITNALTFVEDTAKNFTYADSVSRAERLEETWQSFVATTDEMYQYHDVPGYVDPNIDFISYEEKFLTAQARLRSLKDSLQPVESVETLSSMNQQSELIEGLAKTGLFREGDLPKITIPRFSGHYQDWPAFRDLFVSAIHSKAHLTGAQKFHHLKGLLMGEAARVLQHMPITEASYDTAWARLNDRFDRPRHILNAFIESFMNLPSARVESSSLLRSISDGAQEILRGLQAIGKDHRDCWLIYVLLSKLDAQTRIRWIEDSRDNTTPTIDEFFVFLEDRCEELELRGQDNSGSAKRQLKSDQTKSFVMVDSASARCPKCKETHGLHKCQQFGQMTNKERRSFTKASGLCFNCLKAGHSAYNCSSKLRCRECQRRHHTLVHHDPDRQNHGVVQGNAVPMSVNTPEFIPGNSSASLQSRQSLDVLYPGLQRRSILPTALIDIHREDGEFITCKALLDSGSELSYITDACVRRLGIRRVRSNITVSGIGSVQAASTLGCCRIFVKSKTSTDTLNAEVHILKKITSSLPNVTFDRGSGQVLSGLRLADPTFNIASEIDILFGAPDVWHILNGEKVLDSQGNPIAIATIFGYVIIAVNSGQSTHAVSCCSVIDIGKSLARFWELEEIDVVAADKDHHTVEDHFKRTHSRFEDDRYVVHLPFKEDNVEFADTLQAAMSRFKALERKFQRDEALQKNYMKFMQEYLQLGHMKEVPAILEASKRCKVFYLPHHAVVGDKLRVVFDGSAKDAVGVSLNDTLHIGPSIQRDLFSVCLRFRFHRYVFSADIVKMFRQIWVTNDHRDYQRILWRDSPHQPIRHFQLCTVTYGTACAPFLSVRVLQQVANDYAEVYPLAARVVLRDFYVDDVLTGASTEENLADLRNELIQLMARAGLELRKWNSNSSLISGYPCEQVMFDDEPTVTKVLGIYWSPASDQLAYKVSLKPNAPATKRQVLSDVSRIFDPLGLLAPVIINFKILFQELWLHNLGWDDPLPLTLRRYWTHCRQDIQNLQNLQVPRYVIGLHNCLELHGFSDASEKAYAAVVYARAIDEEGCKVMLVASKTRVAPLKKISLPRLELCGALLLARLLKRITAALTTRVVVRAWSDSTIVLAWLSHNPSKLKTYVANRVTEILETLPRDCWRHVRSKENPADCASRGMLATKLLAFSLWWKGPSWLADSKQCNLLERQVYRPDSVLSEECQAEFRSNTAVLVTTPADRLGELITRCSSWNRLVRVVAWVRRFAHNAKGNKGIRKTGSMGCDEFEEARLCLLKHSQTTFSIEMRDLRSKQIVSKCSKLYKLNPFLAADGLLRVGGRISNSDLSFGTKHPIILDQSSHVAQLIVEYEHVRNLHAGVNALFVIVRQTYWLLGARNTIRKVVHKCLRCFRQRRLTMQQMMADLPMKRVRQAFPFERAGCDYAGPVMVKLYSGKNAKKSKGYICLFVCLVTSAIHVELASDLSTECFLAALRRFTSRRGKCKEICSDNGRNFLGASRALNDLHQALMSSSRNDLVSASLMEDGTRWTYIPPYAPHWGGIWESAVRSVKLHLMRVLGDTVLTAEQMTTLLTQIEAVVNSRPLGSAADTDCDYLSPAHFLIGRPYTSIPEGELSAIPENRLTYWNHVQALFQGFWKRWHQEYLTSLQNRPKWNQPQRNISSGSVVVIQEPNMPPAKWLLGKVVEVYPGDDGLVRVVKLKTKNGHMTRPITKVAPLPGF